MNRRFLIIYCALNAAFVLLGLALCGSGFFGAGSFGVRALAWLLSLEAGFLGAFGAVYFSFRAYRNKIEDELRAGKYDEILRQSSKNSAGFISGETSASDTNSASLGGENRGDASGDDKFNMNDCATCGNSHGGINDEASDSSQDNIGERYDDLKSGASGDWSDGTDRNNHSDGADSGNRGGNVDSGEPGDGTSDFEGGIGGAHDGSNDDFDGADGNVDDWDDECERSEVRSNFAGAFFSPFKILSYAALVAAIYLLAELSLLNPLAIILGVTIIPLGTMIAAFGAKDAR